jgi:ornithine cyclodeaminase/alanine dehydrogenase-like protein (mu-crystallin family)
MATAPPLRYLSAADVAAAMPPIDERLELAERTMVALVHDAELPAKIGVHPRQDGSFAHAMPAHLRGAAGAAGDLLGIKWVTGFPDNAAMGLPAINAVVVMSDPATGLPVAILDGGPITAQRTAAVSGVAIARFGRAGATGAALIGAGVQGHSHLPVIAHQLPGVRLAIHDRQPDRAEALAAEARATPGIASVEVALAARDAVAGADVVVTAASFAPPSERQSMTNDWLAPDALVVAIDYATMAAAEVARDAALFLTDERGQFLANREAGQFDGYPDPTATIGEAILDGRTVPARGRILVSHLGVGLADVIFADAILRRAEALGIGMELPR